MFLTLGNIRLLFNSYRIFTLCIRFLIGITRILQTPIQFISNRIRIFIISIRFIRKGTIRFLISSDSSKLFGFGTPLGRSLKRREEKTNQRKFVEKERREKTLNRKKEESRGEVGNDKMETEVHKG